MKQTFNFESSRKNSNCLEEVALNKEGTKESTETEDVVTKDIDSLEQYLNSIILQEDLNLDSGELFKE